MKTIRNLLASFSLIAAAATVHAQTTTGPGVLGQRYADLSFGVEDIRRFRDHPYSVGVGVNLPVTPMLDVGFDYGRGWLNSTFDVRSDTLSASATLFTNAQGMKPFAGAAIGMQWTQFRAPGFRDRDDNGVWALGAGVELPLARITLTPGLAYADSFASGSTGAIHAGVEASTWFNSKLGGYADIRFSDLRGSGGESWNYTVGLRLRF